MSNPITYESAPMDTKFVNRENGPPPHFYANMILIVSLAALVFAILANIQFLAHNTVMTYDHKFLLYGLYSLAGFGLVAYAGLHLFSSRPKNCCI